MSAMGFLLLAVGYVLRQVTEYLLSSDKLGTATVLVYALQCQARARTTMAFTLNSKEGASDGRYCINTGDHFVSCCSL